MREDDNPALILIDIQKGFGDTQYWGGRWNNSDAVENAAKLLEFWRLHKLPLFHIQHCSLVEGSPFAEGNAGNEFMEIVKPRKEEIVVKKNVSSAFIGTGLKQLLDGAGIKKLVIAGLTTNHCVSTTARMAGNYGYITYVISDATATFGKEGVNGQKFPAEIMHETALASLKDEFATVLKMEELLSFFNLS